MRIAFCGIDGAGKTSLIQKLNNEYVDNGNRVTVRKLQLQSQKVLKGIAKDVTGNQDEFLNVLPTIWGRIALAFEFYDYYRHIDEISDMDYIFCDRYDICYKVYSKVYGVTDLTQIERVFDLVPKPDIYVYLRIDVDTALNRINQRNEERTFDEQECYLRPAIKYYDEYFNSIKTNVLILDATKDIDYLCAKTRKYIDEIRNKKICAMY